MAHCPSWAVGRFETCNLRNQTKRSIAGQIDTRCGHGDQAGGRALGDRDRQIRARYNRRLGGGPIEGHRGLPRNKTLAQKFDAKNQRCIRRVAGRYYESMQGREHTEGVTMAENLLDNAGNWRHAVHIGTTYKVSLNLSPDWERLFHP